MHPRDLRNPTGALQARPDNPDKRHEGPGQLQLPGPPEQLGAVAREDHADLQLLHEPAEIRRDQSVRVLEDPGGRAAGQVRDDEHGLARLEAGRQRQEEQNRVEERAAGGLAEPRNRGQAGFLGLAEVSSAVGHRLRDQAVELFGQEGFGLHDQVDGRGGCFSHFSEQSEETRGFRDQ